MRAATLVEELNSKGAGHWVLVLLPWPRLYHWRSSGVQQRNRKWEEFFELRRLNEYVPTIEFDEYVTQEGYQVEKVWVPGSLVPRSAAWERAKVWVLFI